MGILKELYDGELYPCEYIACNSKECAPLNKKIDELQKYMEASLQPEQVEKVLEMKELLERRSACTEYLNFAHGFKLGARFVNEMYIKE